MPKGWTTIRTDRGNALTKAEVTKQAKIANSVIRKTKSKKYEDLEKEAKDAYAASVAREDSLIAAKANGILKSKALKKEAARIKKKREEKETSKSTPNKEL